ncbi:exonuclease domain-containing protein [Acetobacteroides hydrogenigenes]|uniref:DNA polymerase-3 subunit epsilon n=1 Tax=Acetobacteroides hydrogenigenes TaxID=979970 RepID=A0A4R2ESN9_9BACT|nr:exonuclease domain-containing protein [Acetobacteroides hydrogenigenes]TCN72268.1 DNA polymerase-3 subunit epsilon [Acetobacteroides hydrogenigenes]
MNYQEEVGMQNQRFAVVDIETSGGDPKRERITEIAIYLLEGGKIVEEFSTLLNPEKSIPSYITKLTGITNEMVRNAPKFYEVAKRIVEITQDAIFVGHNVGFDYGFVQNEFKRLGYRYRRVTFDTVRVSRKLLPGHASYSLGNLSADLGITLENRHRAAGDARATVDLFRILLDKAVEEEIVSTIQIEKKFGKNISRMLFETLPEDTGVYYLHDSSGNIIYIGKGTNIAKRATTHFASYNDPKAHDMCSRVADISYELTTSELIALLKEDIEIKRQRPLFNHLQRRKSSGYGLYATYNDEGYLALGIAKSSKNGVLVATFPSVQKAKKMLFSLIEQFSLCQKICGLYKSTGACFHYQIGICKGACRGEEDPDLYNQRVEQAIAYLNDITKNFFVVEEDKDSDMVSIVKVEKGKFVGYGYASKDFLSGNQHELHDLITSSTETSNSIKIINAYIGKSRTAKVIQF